MNHMVLGLITVDLVIIFSVYLFVFHGERNAGVFIIGQGFIVDILSGGIFGLFTLVYLIVFLCVKLASGPLDFHSIGGLIVTVWMAVFLKEILLVAFLYIFPLEVTISVKDFSFFILSAICSGIIAPFIFHFMNILGRFLIGTEGEI